MELAFENSTTVRSKDQFATYYQMFYVLCSLHLILNLVSIVLNLLLLRAQSRCRADEIYERVLIYQLTLSYLLLPLQSSCKDVLRLVYAVAFDTIRIPWMRWLHSVRDSLTIGIDLTYVLVARYCSSILIDFYDEDDHRRTTAKCAYRIITAVWMISVPTAIVGVTPRGDAGILRGYTEARVVAYVGLAVILAFIIYELLRVKKLGRKLNDDFQLNQAHQKLSARLRLKRTQTFTRTMLAILKMHILVSIFTWTVDFLADYFVRNVDTDYFNYVDVNVGLALNILQSTCSLGYPLIYCYTHRRTRSLMSTCVGKVQPLFQVKMGQEIAAAAALGGQIASGSGHTAGGETMQMRHILNRDDRPVNGDHFRIMDDIWDKQVVSKTRFHQGIKK